MSLSAEVASEIIVGVLDVPDNTIRPAHEAVAPELALCSNMQISVCVFQCKFRYGLVNPVNDVVIANFEDVETVEAPDIEDTSAVGCEIAVVAGHGPPLAIVCDVVLEVGTVLNEG